MDGQAYQVAVGVLEEDARAALPQKAGKAGRKTCPRLADSSSGNYPESWKHRQELKFAREKLIVDSR